MSRTPVTSIIEYLGRLDRYLRGLVPSSFAFWRACAVPALAVILILGSSRLPKLWALTRRGDRVEGVVVGTPCAGGPRFAYRFIANGQSFEGVGRASWVGLDCSALAAGMQVPVYYLSDEPSVNAPATDLPRAMTREEIVVVLMGCVALLGTAGVLLAVRKGGFHNGEH
jgi:hypothetical protein